MKIILQTDRLLFREFRMDDALLIYQLNSDPEVIKYVHEAPTSDLTIASSILKEHILPQYIQYGYGRWAIYLQHDREFIGWCGLKYRSERKETDLGYRLIRKHWGQGYATEAAKAVLKYGFESLKIPVITARAHIENKASLAIIEKCGMHFQCFEEVDACPVKTYLLSNPDPAVAD